MGNLTRDPEMRVTPTGLSIAKFGLAVSRSFKTQDGAQKDEVTFIDVDAFGKQAEVISKYFSKGKPIFVEGRLRLDQWDTSSGEKRNRIVVVLESFQFMGGGRNEEGGGSPYESSAPAGRQQVPVNASGTDDVDDDIPF